jgi:predicted DNA repair protein MutK
VGEVESEPLLRLAAILAIVAVLITVMVYGVVAVIVKVDDVGLRLVEVGGRWAGLGRKLVTGMPKLLTVLATVGTAAMLWVGGHIEIEGLHALGVDWPYEPVHQLEEIIRESAGALGGFLAWSVNTLASAVVGLAVGALIVVVLQQVAKRRATPGH